MTPMPPPRHLPMQRPPISIHNNKNIRTLTRQTILNPPKRAPPRTINRPRPVLLRLEMLEFPPTLVPPVIGAVVDERFFARGGAAGAEFGEEGEAVVGGLLVVLC